MNKENRQSPDQTQPLIAITPSELNELETQQTYIKAYQLAQQRFRLFLSQREEKKKKSFGRSFLAGIWRPINGLLDR